MLEISVTPNWHEMKNICEVLTLNSRTFYYSLDCRHVDNQNTVINSLATKLLFQNVKPTKDRLCDVAARFSM